MIELEKLIADGIVVKNDSDYSIEFRKAIKKNNAKSVKFIVTPIGCWECTSHTAKQNKYTTLCINGVNTRIHRYSYSYFKGTIPNGLWVLHKCDNPSCFNPNHLTVGTHTDNIYDMCSKNRNTRGEQHAKAKLTEAQVREIRFISSEKGQSSGALSRIYNVSERTIRFIAKGKTWKHVL